MKSSSHWMQQIDRLLLANSELRQCARIAIAERDSLSVRNAALLAALQSMSEAPAGMSADWYEKIASRAIASRSNRTLTGE